MDDLSFFATISGKSFQDAKKHCQERKEHKEKEEKLNKEKQWSCIKQAIVKGKKDGKSSIIITDIPQWIQTKLWDCGFDVRQHGYARYCCPKCDGENPVCEMCFNPDRPMNWKVYWG